ncbi:hypothetical protein [Streptomyces sp. YIM 98790]|uniref:hypothetical protein n=1 Tax=Streptomyces sp. YIM 98790 TaxID=2689077 RepID=UPI001FB7449A|nr:hypothetical protein [Streptomyces sp. YIM 98790]
MPRSTSRTTSSGSPAARRAGRARHAARPARRRSPALLRTSLTLSALGAALGTAAAPAQADTGGGAPPPGPLTAIGYSLGPLKTLPLNPMAGTGSDPLDNSAGTQLADFPPVSTTLLTGPLAEGGGLTDLPLAGPVLHRLIPGTPA